MYDDFKSLTGPFKDANEIAQFWYTVEEKHLKEEVDLANKTLDQQKKELNNKKELSKQEKEFLKESIKQSSDSTEEYSKQLQVLQDFVEDFVRCSERFKYKRKMLKDIDTDWREYNLSLYHDYCDMMFGVYGGYDRLSEEETEQRRTTNKREKIKRQEIAKRMKDRLL